MTRRIDRSACRGEVCTCHDDAAWQPGTYPLGCSACGCRWAPAPDDGPDPIAGGWAFFDAHEACPDRVEWLIWSPHGRPEASITLTCLCGARQEFPCGREHAAAVLAVLYGRGFPVRAIHTAPGVQ